MARITSTDAGSAVRCRWHRQPPISAAACMLSASMKCMPSSEIASKLAAIRDCCWKSALGAKLGIARAQRVGGAAGMARVLSNVFPRGRVLHGRGYQAVRAPSRLQRVPLARASTPEYQGKFGTWRVEEEDVREVFLYRLGLNVAAAGAVTECVASLLPDSPVGSVLHTSAGLENAVALLGAGGLGLSLALIHVYVAPLKRAVQVLFATGLAGGLFLIASHPGEGVVAHVATHPSATWLVGPLFAAVTGVGVKEGLCYGKPECTVLAALTPVMCLAHLSGLCPAPVESTAVVLFAATCAVFAARKWSQDVKDDIGDKSVFQFLALSERDQERVLAGEPLSVVASGGLATREGAVAGVGRATGQGSAAGEGE